MKTHTGGLNRADGQTAAAAAARTEEAACTLPHTQTDTHTPYISCVIVQTDKRTAGTIWCPLWQLTVQT